VPSAERARSSRRTDNCGVMTQPFPTESLESSPSLWHARCYVGGMDHSLSRLVTASALSVLAGVLAITACTRTTERVIVPVGGGDASAPESPEVGDAGVNPIGPIAHPIEPAEDFRLVRAPEFGAGLALPPDTHLVDFVPARQASGLGGTGAGGAGGGVGGSDHRPVSACGGTKFY